MLTLSSQLKTNLMFQLGVAYRTLLQRSNEALDDTGLMAPHCLLLLSLKEEEGVNQRTLARKLCLDASTITILLGRLESLGLVERVPDASDRRAKRAYLTPKGREVLKKIEAGMERIDTYVRELFPDEAERTALLNALMRVSQRGE